MRAWFKLLIISVFFFGKTSAQSYVVTPGLTIHHYLDTMVVAHYEGFTIANTGSVNLNLTFTLLSKDTLNDCEFDLCNSGTCYNTLHCCNNLPVITPGYSRFIFIHSFTGKTYGTNKIRYLLQNGTSQTDTLTYYVHVVNTSGVKELFNERSLHFYPNPPKDILYLKTNSTEQYSAGLFDLSGRLVHFSASLFSNAAIDTKGIPAGAYFLKINFASGKAETYKLIKQD